MVTRALVLALAVLALSPAAALAHAQLEGTSPERGAVLQTQPSAVVFRFGEPVEGNFGAVKVFDAKGERVDNGKVVHPGGRGSEVAVGLKPHLADGTYTATYRVISADSHPVEGGVVFSIGTPGAAGETVADLLAGASAGPVTETAFGVVRGLDYLAIALAVGGLAFLLAAWRPALAVAAGAGADWPEAAAVFAGRARRLLWIAVVIGVVSGVLGIVLQGATASGTTFWSALDPSVGARGPRHAVRDRVGPARARVARARRGVARGCGHPRGRGAAPGGGRRGRRRPGAWPLARRACRAGRSGGLSARLARAGRTRDDAASGGGAAAPRRGPRHRDERLGRRAGHAAVRRAGRDPQARAARAQPAAGGGARALLADGACVRGGAPGHGRHPGADRHGRSVAPVRHAVRPCRAHQVRAADGAHRARRSQPPARGSVTAPPGRRTARRPVGRGAYSTARCAPRSCCSSSSWASPRRW